MELIIQLIGFVGLLVNIFAFQFKKHNHIVYSKMTSELLFSIQYIFLAAWTAAVLDFISVIRNLIFCRLVKKNIPTTPVILVFALFVIATGIFTFDGIGSLLPIAAKLLTTVSYGMKNERLLRLITLPSCILWAVYNLAVGSIAGAIADSLTLGSLLIAMYKFDFKKQAESAQ